jgi:enterobactin synthetase component D
MPSPTRSPALFPTFVAQHSVLFDPEDARDFARQFPGVALPAALRRAVRKRQTEFLAGRHCVREALRGCAPEHADVAVGIGAQREPLWPDGIVGAITHAHGFASAAVARAADARGIGLDAERLMPEEQAREVLGQVAAPDEVAALVEATGWSAARVLTGVFSAKETIFKCLYGEVRRYFDFREAWVDAFDLDEGTFRAHLLVTLTGALRAGYALRGTIEIGEGSVCTGMVLGV